MCTNAEVPSLVFCAEEEESNYANMLAVIQDDIQHFNKWQNCENMQLLFLAIERNNEMEFHREWQTEHTLSNLSNLQYKLYHCIAMNSSSKILQYLQKNTTVSNGEIFFVFETALPLGNPVFIAELWADYSNVLIEMNMISLISTALKAGHVSFMKWLYKVYLYQKQYQVGFRYFNDKMFDYFKKLNDAFLIACCKNYEKSIEWCIKEFQFVLKPNIRNTFCCLNFSKVSTNTISILLTHYAQEIGDFYYNNCMSKVIRRKRLDILKLLLNAQKQQGYPQLNQDDISKLFVCTHNKYLHEPGEKYVSDTIDMICFLITTFQPTNVMLSKFFVDCLVKCKHLNAVCDVCAFILVKAQIPVQEILPCGIVFQKIVNSEHFKGVDTLSNLSDTLSNLSDILDMRVSRAEMVQKVVGFLNFYLILPLTNLVLIYLYDFDLQSEHANISICAQQHNAFVFFKDFGNKQTKTF